MADPQDTIPCPGCGIGVPYDRWADYPRDMFCSEACRRASERKLGARLGRDRYEERARDPQICVMCCGPMERAVRVDAVYCSPRCQKAGRRAGIDADRLMAIRLSGKTG